MITVSDTLYNLITPEQLMDLEDQAEMILGNKKLAYPVLADKIEYVAAGNSIHKPEVHIGSQVWKWFKTELTTTGSNRRFLLATYIIEESK